MNEVILKVAGFSAVIGDKRLLHQLELSIDKGEWVGLTGRSGAGKSLLGKCLAGLAPGGLQSEGSIFFHKDEVGPQLTDRDPRRFGLSYMPQDPAASFNPIQRIGRQIEEVFTRLAGYSAGAARDQCLQTLEQLEFEDAERIRRAYPHELSGGQAQRALLCMLSAKQPDLFILDEPTTDLDLLTETEVLRLVRTISDELQAGLLFITHDIDVLMKYCDRIIFIEEGRIGEEWDTSARDRIAPSAVRTSAAKQLIEASLRLEELSKSNKGLNQPDPGNRRTPLLSVKNLSKMYRTKRSFLNFSSSQVNAVDRFSYAFYPGRIYGVLGVSGSGKSTLASLMSGSTSPDSGWFQWKGEKHSVQSYRKTIHKRGGVQLMYQNPYRSFDPTKSLGFSIREAAADRSALDDSSFRELRNACAVGKDWLLRYPHELSGGQLQRMAVLRAILMEPAVLIADESTSALDTVNQLQLLELFESMARERDTAIVFFSHQIQLLLAFCDEMLVLKDGQLVESGNAAAMIRRSNHPFFETYRKLLLK